MLTGTQWGVTNQIPLAGPLSNQQLAFQTYGVNIASPYAGYQVNGPQGYIYATSPYTQTSAGYFQISPAGQNDTDQNTIAYVASSYVWPRNWVAGEVGIAGGTLLSGVANIYRKDASGTNGSIRPSWTTGTSTDGNSTYTVYHEHYPVTADTDFVILDNNLFIEGMRWAWYESKQQFDAASRYEAKWRSSVRSALGRQNGAVSVSAAYDSSANYDFPFVSDGSWPGTGGG